MCLKNVALCGFRLVGISLCGDTRSVGIPVQQGIGFWGFCSCRDFVFKDYDLLPLFHPKCLEDHYHLKIHLTHMKILISVP